METDKITRHRVPNSELVGYSVRLGLLGFGGPVALVGQMERVGDRMQGWLDGALLLNHRGARFQVRRVGVWTKADSITAFDDLVIRSVMEGR